MPSKVKSVQNNDPITLIMQWLTYAFWGWLSMGLLWLSFVVLKYFIVGAGTDDWGSQIAYPIASVIVLYVAASVFDVFYRRREPAHKTGFAGAIMVIHTVIFAMFAIGAFITGLFIAINLLISPIDSEQDYKYIGLIASLIQLVVFSVFLIRTSLVHKVPKASSYTVVGIGALAAVFIAAGVAGPLAKSVTSKQDTLVTTALSDASSNVQAYTDQKGELPAKLEDINSAQADRYTYVDSDAVDYALEHDLVKYKPSTLPNKVESDGSTTYFYQLCGKFDKDTTKDKSSKHSKLGLSSNIENNYSSSYDADFGLHSQGEQCYNLKATAYQYKYN